MVSGEPDFRKAGPIEGEVKKRWDEVFQYIKDGDPYAKQIEQIFEYIALKEEENKINGMPDEATIDINMAKFVHDYSIKNTMKNLCSYREGIVSFSNEFSKRVGGVADELLKFLIRTLIVSHGAVIIASIAALSQSELVQLRVFLFVSLLVSFIGIILAGAGFRYSNISVDFSSISINHLSESKIIEKFEKLQKPGWWRISDWLLYISGLLFLFEGGVAAYTLWPIFTGPI